LLAFSSKLFLTSISFYTVAAKFDFTFQHKTTRELVLNFLAIFLHRIGNFVKPYVKNILKVCANVFQKERYSKNKDKTLQIIKQVYLSLTIIL